jgi:hypothetical protein
MHGHGVANQFVGKPFVFEIQIIGETLQAWRKPL